MILAFFRAAEGRSYRVVVGRKGAKAACTRRVDRQAQGVPIGGAGDARGELLAFDPVDRR